MIQSNMLIETLLQSLNKGEIKSLNLRQGQMIHGQVLDVIDNKQAIVSIQGNKLLAKMEVPLAKGQQSWFMVTSTSDEFKLKIITETNSQSKVIDSQAGLLKHLNINNTAKNREIVSELMKNNLPIEKGTIESIVSLTNKENNFKSLLTAVKVLNDKQLPVTVNNISALNEFFNDQDFIGKLTELNQKLENHFAGKEMQILPKEVNSLLEKVYMQSKQLIDNFKLSINNNNNININNTVSAKSNSANIEFNSLKDIEIPNIDSKQLLPRLIRFFEEMQFKPAVLKQEQANNSFNQKTMENTQLKGITQEFSKAENFNQQKENNQAGSKIIEQPEYKINQKIDIINRDGQIQEVNKEITQPIKPDNLEPVEKLKTKLANQTIPETVTKEQSNLKQNIESLFLVKESLPKDLITSLDKTTQHIAGQQLMVSEDPNIFTQTILQIPGFQPFSNKPVHIQIHSKKKDKKKINPEDLRLAFLFQLEHLDDLIVWLHIVKKQMYIQILNDNPFIKEIIKELEPAIIEYIREQGYQTSGISIQAMKNMQNTNFLSSLSSSSYKGLDVRI